MKRIKPKNPHKISWDKRSYFKTHQGIELTYDDEIRNMSDIPKDYGDTFKFKLYDVMQKSLSLHGIYVS